MSIQNTKEIIDQKIVNIIDLFHTKLDTINSKTSTIEQIKVESVDEFIPMEVTQLNTESYEYQLNDSFSDIKEK